LINCQRIDEYFPYLYGSLSIRNEKAKTVWIFTENNATFVTVIFVPINDELKTSDENPCPDPGAVRVKPLPGEAVGRYCRKIDDPTSI
jgi:hypothetical protein